jgi:hypothetical protein
MPRLLCLPALLALTLFALPVGAQEYVSEQGGGGRFALASEGLSAPLHVGAGERPGVVRAARDLQADVHRRLHRRPAAQLPGPPGELARRSAIASVASG